MFTLRKLISLSGNQKLSLKEDVQRWKKFDQVVHKFLAIFQIAFDLIQWMVARCYNKPRQIYQNLLSDNCV